MPVRKNMVGFKIGRLSVVRDAGNNRHGQSMWECFCECGNSVVVCISSLTSECTLSCGCLHKDKHTTHGKYSSSEYRIWSGVIQRCTNPNHVSYKDYGGRGISVCEEWLKFENFYRDMGDKPSPKHSIDRIDNNGNYCKENCRWATRKEQANNCRNTVVIRLHDEEHTLSEWSCILGIGKQTLSARIRSRWPVEAALTTPVGVKYG